MNRSKSTPTVLAAAFEALDAGLSVVAIRAIGEPVFLPPVDGAYHPAIDPVTGQQKLHGAKIPCGPWTHLRHERIDPARLRRLLGSRADRGLALVCGFGNLEALDFDDEPTWRRFEEAARLNPTLAPILERIAAGYFEVSPRGAPHLLYRSEDLHGGGPLARSPQIVTYGDGKKAFKVLIETAGQGSSSWSRRHPDHVTRRANPTFCNAAVSTRSPRSQQTSAENSSRWPGRSTRFRLTRSRHGPSMILPLRDAVK